jgi:hypothetical protein
MNAQEEFMTSSLALHPEHHLPKDMTDLLMRVRNHIDLLYGSFTCMQEMLVRLSKNYRGKSFRDDRSIGKFRFIL